MRPLFLCFTLLAELLHAQPQQQQPGLGSCYFPSNSVSWARNEHPCNLYSEISACCPTGWTCFSNFLCIATDPNAAGAHLGTTRRGSCTDPDWNEGSCGSFCLDGGQDGDMTACGNDTWCCSSDIASGSCNCGSGKGTFTIDQGKALGIVGFVNGHITLTTGTAVPTSTGPMVKPSHGVSKATSGSAAASTTNGAAASTTSSPSGLSSVSAAASTTASSSTSSSSSAAAITSNSSLSSSASSTSGTPSSSSSSRLGKILGPIFGILGLALLLALAWFFWRRHKTRQDRDSSTPAPSDDEKPGPYMKETGPPMGDATADGRQVSALNDRSANPYPSPPIRSDISPPPPPAQVPASGPPTGAAALAHPQARAPPFVPAQAPAPGRAPASIPPVRTSNTSPPPAPIHQRPTTQDQYFPASPIQQQRPPPPAFQNPSNTSTNTMTSQHGYSPIFATRSNNSAQPISSGPGPGPGPASRLMPSVGTSQLSQGPRGRNPAPPLNPSITTSVSAAPSAAHSAPLSSIGSPSSSSNRRQSIPRKPVGSPVYPTSISPPPAPQRWGPR